MNNSTIPTEEINGSNWMSSRIELLGPRTLRQICMPGSHDSGMSTDYYDNLMPLLFYPFVGPCNTVTQHRGIGSQLACGARYFDIRPVYNGVDTSVHSYFTGHYQTFTIAGEPYSLGANGESFDSIITKINDFTSLNNELIILNISNGIICPRGGIGKGSFTLPVWKNLIQHLFRINHLFISTDPNITLSQISLNKFTQFGTQPAVLLIIEMGNENIPPPNLGPQQGFYFKNANLDPLPMINEYSDTVDIKKMAFEQFRKMRENYNNPKLFLLSWTLTLQAVEVGACNHPGSIVKGILANAKTANEELLQPGRSHNSEFIRRVQNAEAFPNIIYLDALQEHNMAQDLMSLVLYVNKVGFPFKAPPPSN